MEEVAKNFLIPPTGGTLSFPSGVSIIDFREGRITLADGTQQEIGETLGDNEFIRSITISTDKDIYVDFGAKGKWGTILHGIPSRITYQKFDVMRIKCDVTTLITIWATTHPTAAPYLILSTEFFQGNPYFEEGTVDTAGTPVIIDIRAKLGRNAHSGRIINKGAGNLYVYLSHDGETYTNRVTLEPNQTLSLEKEDVWKIKLDTDTSGNAYLVVAH